MKINELANAKANISKPVSFDEDSQMIFDADGKHLLDIRGWGWIQYKTNGSEIQDSIGKYIAECINSCPDELILIEP